MITFDRWTVRQLEFTIPELAKLWIKLQEFPTLFSDSTRGDIRNWISLTQDPSTVWYEVFEGEELIGLIYLIVQDDDADGHIVFFDRRPAEKKELVKRVCQLLFDGLPRLARISASIPAIYYSTWRLAKAVGFKWEGSKREAVVIGGKRIDVHLYGMLRSEANGLSHRQDQRDQRDALRHSGAEGEYLVPTSAGSGH